MVCGVHWNFLCRIVLFILFLVLVIASTIHAIQLDYSLEFRKIEKVFPRFDSRIRRESNGLVEKSPCNDFLSVSYNTSDGKETILELQLNKKLLPETYFESYQSNGKPTIEYPKNKTREICHYNGKIRGISNSWTSVSINPNQELSGMIFDGSETHFIETTFDQSSNEIRHLILKDSDRIFLQNHTCDSPPAIPNREKRSLYPKVPHNANSRSRYVELIIVVDNSIFRKYGSSRSKIIERVQAIANIMNNIYMPLNIFIALSGVVIWSERDEIHVSNNGDATLKSFMQYRKDVLLRHHRHDNAQLIVGSSFGGGIIGKAHISTICTTSASGGVNADHSSTVGLVAGTIAHEMGHNFGMEHDTSECSCPDERCVMAGSSSSMLSKHWSSCSHVYVALTFEHGLDYCLHNKPEKLLDFPICGNGFVEEGEECDCGIPRFCNNKCCDPNTCRLHSNSTCATGECCNLNSCQVKSVGTECRRSHHECDLPEFCNGLSEYCPDDLFKMDSEPCDSQEAYCYQGNCRGRDEQCRLLWGNSAMSSNDMCYNKNVQGDSGGNCGYDFLDQTYSKCGGGDVLCGKLFCRHLNEKLGFGFLAEVHYSVISTVDLSGQRTSVPCRSVRVDLGLDQLDPGLVPNGARCGQDKMCLNQKCVSIAHLRHELLKNISDCSSQCNGNGYCNNLGHCHCFPGFAPPFCDAPGAGGSIDSGPARNPNVNFYFQIVLYSIFLGVVPLLLIVFVVLYRSPKTTSPHYTWMKFVRSPRTPKRVPDQKLERPARPNNLNICHRGLLSTTNENIHNNFSNSRVISIHVTTNDDPVEVSQPKRWSQRKISMKSLNKLKLNVSLKIKDRNLLTPEKCLTETEAMPGSATPVAEEITTVQQLAKQFEKSNHNN